MMLKKVKHSNLQTFKPSNLQTFKPSTPKSTMFAIKSEDKFYGPFSDLARAQRAATMLKGELITLVQVNANILRYRPASLTLPDFNNMSHSQLVSWAQSTTPHQVFNYSKRGMKSAFEGLRQYVYALAQWRKLKTPSSRNLVELCYSHLHEWFEPHIHLPPNDNELPNETKR